MALVLLVALVLHLRRLVAVLVRLQRLRAGAVPIHWLRLARLSVLNTVVARVVGTLTSLPMVLVVVLYLGDLVVVVAVALRLLPT